MLPSTAHEAAGDRDVRVEGGADVVRQALDLGAVDEFRLHIVPILLGDGTRLFAEGRRSPDFESAGRVDEGGVVHLTLRPRARGG